MNIRPSFLPLLVVAWGTVVAAGFVFVWGYKTEAGERAAAPSTWPAPAPFARDAERPTLVLSVHPRCVCTRATVTELAKLMSRSGGGLSTTVLFVRPEGTDDGWERGDLWDRVAAIPGARPIVDGGGKTSALFGATTSGQAFLFDAAGRLRYSGGLTFARGHEGPSAGTERILAVVRGGRPDVPAGPAYGCPLSERASGPPRV